MAVDRKELLERPLVVVTAQAEPDRDQLARTRHALARILSLATNEHDPPPNRLNAIVRLAHEGLGTDELLGRGESANATAAFRVRDFLGLIRDYLEHHPRGSTGGDLHCWLSDGNVRDGDIRFEIEGARERQDDKALLLAVLAAKLSHEEREEIEDRGYGAADPEPDYDGPPVRLPPEDLRPRRPIPTFTPTPPTLSDVVAEANASRLPFPRLCPMCFRVHPEHTRFCPEAAP